MLKSFVVSCFVVVATAGPAFAQSDCSEPLPPATVNGAGASEKQINETTQDVKMFLKQSTDYQDCLVRGLKAQEARAAHDKKPLDPTIGADVQSKIDENQKLKEQVGTELNSAVFAFCKGHSTVAGCDKVLKGPQ